MVLAGSNPISHMSPNSLKSPAGWRACLGRTSSGCGHRHGTTWQRMARPPANGVAARCRRVVERSSLGRAAQPGWCMQKAAPQETGGYGSFMSYGERWLERLPSPPGWWRLRAQLPARARRPLGCGPRVAELRSKGGFCVGCLTGLWWEEAALPAFPVGPRLGVGPCRVAPRVRAGKRSWRLRRGCCCWSQPLCRPPCPWGTRRLKLSVRSY